MFSTIGKCKLFRIKHNTLLEGETILRNKHKIAFFQIKCTFFVRKENTISLVCCIYKEREKKKTKTARKANIQPSTSTEYYSVRMRIIHISYVLRVNVDSWRLEINNIMHIVKYEYNIKINMNAYM